MAIQVMERHSLEILWIQVLFDYRANNAFPSGKYNEWMTEEIMADLKIVL